MPRSSGKPEVPSASYLPRARRHARARLPADLIRGCGHDGAEASSTISEHVLAFCDLGIPFRIPDALLAHPFGQTGMDRNEIGGGLDSAFLKTFHVLCNL